MIKILFLIHDLGRGGAEKVLVNLVNHLDLTKFEISVTALFGGGEKEAYLRPEIHVHTVFPRAFPGNSTALKLLSPRQLHCLCVKEEYDIEVSYLEGPSARIISGCQNKKTRLISWIHVEQHTKDELAKAFRSRREAIWCYRQFHQTICVSKAVQKDFQSILPKIQPCQVLYNTVESETIRRLAKEDTPELAEEGRIRLIAVGSLKKSKGYERLLEVVRKLKKQNFAVHLYILGEGPERKKLEEDIRKKHLEAEVTLLGYRKNPYPYIQRCSVLVCASFAEGFSTAVTEALILGTAVCTVDVSGMKELLGEHNEYGIVTKNETRALYEGVARLLKEKELLTFYRRRAVLRGKEFSTEPTVKAVEKMLENVMEEGKRCRS